MIRQNNNWMMIIFKIMFSLLKRCNNIQKFLIIHLITNFNKNYLFRIKCNEISLRLFNVIRECHELKQNNCDDKIQYIDLYFNEIIEIKMNQHKYFYKCFNKSSKRLSCNVVKDEWFVLLYLFIFFKQFRQKLNNFNIKSHETFIKSCKF